MKLFCAYAYTGEDIKLITTRMKMVVETLGSVGHSAYCNRFDPIVDELQHKCDVKGIFSSAFTHVTQSDAVVAIIASPNRSIGQIMEIGVALSQGKPVYLFEHEFAQGTSYLHTLADQYFVWKTDEELQTALRAIPLSFKNVPRNVA